MPAPGKQLPGAAQAAAASQRLAAVAHFFPAEWAGVGRSTRSPAPDGTSCINCCAHGWHAGCRIRGATASARLPPAALLIATGAALSTVVLPVPGWLHRRAACCSQRDPSRRSPVSACAAAAHMCRGCLTACPAGCRGAAAVQLLRSAGASAAACRAAAALAASCMPWPPAACPTGIPRRRERAVSQPVRCRAAAVPEALQYAGLRQCTLSLVVVQGFQPPC